MAEDPPQQPVEFEWHGESVRAGGEIRKGLDSMMVAAPDPVSQLPRPEGATPQSMVGGDGASPQGSAQDVPPAEYVDYDG